MRPMMFGETGVATPSGLANPNGRAKYGAYAYFPGSGPRDETCEHCIFARRPGHCMKWLTLMLPGADEKTLPPKIDLATPACKYFEQRGAKNG